MSTAAAVARSAPAGRAEQASTYLVVLIGAALLALAAACGVAIAFGEMGAFYATLSLAAAFAIMYDFRIGAVLLIVMLGMGATNLFPYGLMGIPGLNPLNIVIAATLLSYLARGQELHRLVPRPLLWLYVLPILVAGWVGIDNWDEIVPFFFESESVNFSSAWGYFREMAIRPLLTVVVGVLVAAAVARSDKPEKFIVALAISIWIVALVEIGFVLASGVHWAVLAAASSRRFFEEIGVHNNSLGRLFAVGYGLLLFVWWETRSKGLKAFLFATLGIAAFAMVLTFSRGAFLGFFLVNAIFLLWKFNARTVSLALAAGAVCAALAPGYLWSRLMFGFDTGANAISANRIDGIWLPLLPEIFKSPIWGNGIGSTLWAYPNQIGAMDPVGHPHNAYLEILLDMGVVGLVLLLAYFWHVWKGLRALGSNAYLSPELRGFFQGACAALLCFLITGWTGSSLRPTQEFAFLWVAIGMMYGVQARKPAS
jgi:O-antigen ligase